MGIESIFGGSGGDASGYRSQADTSAAGLSGMGNIYGQKAQRGADQANYYRPKVRSAAENFARMLEQGTTDDERNRFIGQSTNGVTTNYLTARNSLLADAARNGVDEGATAASLAGLEGGRAGAITQAQGNAANYFDDRRFQRAGQLSDLYGGMYSQGNNEENQALGAHGDIMKYLSQFYGNQAQAAQASDDARFGSVIQGITGLASGGATLLGRGGKVVGKAGT